MKKMPKKDDRALASALARPTGTEPGKSMRHGEPPLMFRTVGRMGLKSSTVPRMARAKVGRLRAKEKTAKEKARGMERKEVDIRAANLRRADVLSAEGDTGHPGAPRTLSRKEVASPRPESKGGIWRKR